MLNRRSINHLGGPTLVCAMAILSGALLVALARWITGPGWPQLLADLAQ